MGRILEMMDLNTNDTKLNKISDKLINNQRLSFEDGVYLFKSEDFYSIGKMANYIKNKVSSDKVFFVVNRHINPTNICVLSCSFCDFAKRVKSGMFNAMVAQKPTIEVKPAKKAVQNCPSLAPPSTN